MGTMDLDGKRGKSPENADIGFSQQLKLISYAFFKFPTYYNLKDQTQNLYRGCNNG